MCKDVCVRVQEALMPAMMILSRSEQQGEQDNMTSWPMPLCGFSTSHLRGQISQEHPILQ